MPWEKQFDESEALERAMQLFWARGFEATSMRELVEGMGINRASIYATYGDKRELFLAALKRYDAVYREAWLTGIAARHEPRSAIVEVFRAVAAMAAGGNHDGCFLVNTALELVPHDEEVRQLVNGALRSAERYFAAMLEADGRDPALAPTLLALFLGMRVLTRCQMGPSTLPTVVEQVEALLPM